MGTTPLRQSPTPRKIYRQAERLFPGISGTSSSGYVRLMSLLDFASSLVESMEILRRDPTIISLSSGTPTALMATLAIVVRDEIVAQRAILCEMHGDLGPCFSGNSRMRVLLMSLDMYLKK